MSGIAKNNWSKKQKYKLLRLGLAEEGREARGADVILAEFLKVLSRHGSESTKVLAAETFH